VEYVKKGCSLLSKRVFEKQKERVFGFRTSYATRRGREGILVLVVFVFVEECKGWQGIYTCVKRG